MSLLLAERTMTVKAALLLPGAALPVTCRLTAEWLRGVTDPTWYGYLIPNRSALRLLPGQYRLRFQGETEPYRGEIGHSRGSAVGRDR